jgi:hypothetical protein
MNVFGGKCTLIGLGNFQRSTRSPQESMAPHRFQFLPLRTHGSPCLLGGNRSRVDFGCQSSLGCEIPAMKLNTAYLGAFEEIGQTR